MDIAQEDYKRLQDWIQREAAIVIEDGKEYLVRARLSPILRSEGMESLKQLLDAATSTLNAGTRLKVIDALTTNETSFFRDNEPFVGIQQVILPELIEKRQALKEISIWSAASSTGQEPFSIAMLLKEHFSHLKDWRFKIFATDLSGAALERARQGVFTQFEVNRGLPIQYLVKYFTKEGKEFRIKPEILSMVTFAESNLSKPFVNIPLSDLVLIRNVLIYFSLDMKRQVLGEIRKILRPDGFLILGSAETTLNVDSNFDRRVFGKTSFYQKNGTPTR